METLQARFDSRNSFYGKAYTTGAKVKKLYSYDTLVASINSKGEFKLHNVRLHSSTTRRHVVEFIKQFAPRVDYNTTALYGKNKMAHY